VALARARDGLYLFPAGPAGKKRTDQWDTVVLKALCPEYADTKDRPERAVYADGEEHWQPGAGGGRPVAVPPAERAIAFAAGDPARRAGQRVAGARRARLRRLSKP